MLVAISKGMQVVKVYSNKILQFLTGVSANILTCTVTKMVVYVVINKSTLIVVSICSCFTLNAIAG